MAIYKFFQADISIPYLETLVGKKIKRLTRGEIETGEFTEGIGGEMVPVKKRGVEIEFEYVLDEATLCKVKCVIDPANLPAELGQLKAEVEEIKKKMGG